MAQVGRISGPLLLNNLERNGVDLAFRNDLDTTQLLYLDVNNGRIGINTATPTRELLVESTIQTTNLISTNGATTPGYEITDSTFRVLSGDIYLNAADAVVMANMENGTIRISDNVISTMVSNANLDLTPHGTGTTEIINDLNVYGNIYTPGTITFGGTITLGDADTDNVTFNSDITSDIIPDATDTYNLGSFDRRWSYLYTNLVNGQSVGTDGLVVDGIDINFRNGGQLYVAQNGNDANKGDHILSPFATIARALQAAEASGNQPFVIRVAAGEYQEALPLVVPPNVTIVGDDFRNTIITPDTSSQSEDVFHLDDTTTIANLTIKDFYYNSVNNTGYAFRFSPGVAISNRSPYVQNVTVLTNPSAGTGGPADIYSDPLGLAGSYSSNSVAVDQINYTQSQVEGWIGKLLMTWNGEGFPVTFYEIVDVTDEPLDPGVFWRIVLDRNLETAGEEFYQFSIYPNNGETSIVGAAGYVASTDYSRSFLKSSLPPFFDTTVGEDWTCQIGEGLNIVDFVEEDPLDSTWWKVNFKSLATLTNGLPIFTSPTSAASADDAGRGAWIDGDELDGSTVEKSMLFHSCTFITPGADVINMTNDVRVEWLNSFTYYANRGLYAFAGVSGGAELRSIGSANVYGNYGAEADGAGTLMYLIQHNFGYIGAGTDNSNDPSTVIQANEIVEINGGQIHFVTTDQSGNFRVGDNFYVNLEDGSTSINIDTGSIESLSGLVINSGGETTFIDGTNIDLGNLNIAANRIASTSGDLNLVGGTGTINLGDNTTINGSLIIRDNFSFDGTLSLAGDNPEFDRVDFNVNFEQNFNPNQHLTFDLGTASKQWKNVYLDRAEPGNIIIDENYITSDTSNADLELRANGTSEIFVPNNDVQIDNNLTVSDITDLQSTTITGSLLHTGDRTQTGNYDIGGQPETFTVEFTVDVDGTFSTAGQLTYGYLNWDASDAGGNAVVDQLISLIDEEEEFSLYLNGDLVLTDTVLGNGAGKVYNIENEFHSVGFRVTTGWTAWTSLRPSGATTGDVIRFEVLSSIPPAKGKFVVDNVYVEDNFITTTAGDLTFGATGDINVDSNDIEIAQNLTVSGTTDLQDTTITGTITHVGNKIQQGTFYVNNANIDGNLDIGSQAQFEEILFDGNVVTTTTSDADLELRANGAGKILVPSTNVEIVNNLSADNITTTGDVGINLETAFNLADLSSIDIKDNYIVTTNADANLELKANGTGIVNLEVSVVIDNDLTANGVTTLKDSEFVYTYGPELVLNGTFNTNLANWTAAGGGSATVVSGTMYINASTAARNMSQTVTVIPGATYDFSIDVVSATLGAPDPADEYYIRVFEPGVGTLLEWTDATLEGNTPITLTDSFVPTTSTVSVIIRASNAIVQVDNVSIIQDIGLIEVVTPVEVNINGAITQTGNVTQTGDIEQTGNTDIDGNLTVSNEVTTSHFNINDLVIQNYREDLRLNPSSPYDPLSLPQIVKAMQLGATVDDYLNQTEKNLINFLANGTTAPYAYSYVDVNQSGTVTSSDALAWLQYVANGATTDPVVNQFIYNVVELLLEDEFANPGKYNSIIFSGDYYRADVVLEANNTGRVFVPANDVRVTNNLFAASIIANDIIVDQDLALNEIVVTDSNIEIDDNFITTRVSNSNLELRAVRDIKVPLNDVILEQDLTVNGSTNLKDLNLIGNITQTGNRIQLGNLNVVGNVTVSSTNIQSEIQFDDIEINDNYISTTASNSNLELRANGAGIISISENNVRIINDLSLGTLASNNIAVSSQTSAEIFEASDNIRIFDNVITTTQSNSDLELRSVNADVVLENFRFNDSTVRTTATAITFSPTNNLVIDTTGAIKIPSGTTAQRQIINNSIRYNSTDSLFEGYNSTGKLVSFGGVYSSNRATSVLAHPTNNTLDFTVALDAVGLVDADKLQIHGLDVDDILIQDNTIVTNVSNSDLEFQTNGTGKLEIYDVTLIGDTIQNNNAGSLTVANTLYGKVKFATTGAVAIPAGTTAEQPASPEVGTTRWNTDETILEVWDGSTFITAAGSSATISAAEMDDLILEYTLIFG